MKKVRNKTFETNSSSTHSLSYTKGNYNYLSKSSTLLIDFIDTDDEYSLSTLREKVSYLVSQIINQYKYDVVDYDDLKKQVENDSDYKTISEYVLQKYNKKLTLPKSYGYDLDDIVNINHQIICYSLNELLESLSEETFYKSDSSKDELSLDDVLSENTIILFGRN